MTYDEMNSFILDYLKNDITGRAIMLTGEWGSGKSYYIKNTLKSYLEEQPNRKLKCIIVSLYGLIIDYIGIRDNMRQALKVYGGNTSVAPTVDDIEQATSIFHEHLALLRDLFKNYDLAPFMNPEANPFERYRLLAKAAEYVFRSTQELNIEGKRKTNKVSFKTYFLKTVKRMRNAYDICQPSGNLTEEESTLAQCFMAIAGFVRKMSGTSEVDTETMNRKVAQMVEEALRYNKVESILEDGEEEDIFSPEYFEKLSDVKMPASKLELLIKMLRKQITEYMKTNQVAAKNIRNYWKKPSVSITSAENILPLKKQVQHRKMHLMRLSEMPRSRLSEY